MIRRSCNMYVICNHGNDYTKLIFYNPIILQDCLEITIDIKNYKHFRSLSLCNSGNQIMDQKKNNYNNTNDNDWKNR